MVGVKEGNKVGVWVFVAVRDGVIRVGDKLVAVRVGTVSEEERLGAHAASPKVSRRSGIQNPFKEKYLFILS